MNRNIKYVAACLLMLVIVIILWQNSTKPDVVRPLSTTTAPAQANPNALEAPLDAMTYEDFAKLSAEQIAQNLVRIDNDDGNPQLMAPAISGLNYSVKILLMNGIPLDSYDVTLSAKTEYSPVNGKQCIALRPIPLRRDGHDPKLGFNATITVTVPWDNSSGTAAHGF